MRTVNKHPQWQSVPLRLSDEEKANLPGVLEEFFLCFHLQDVRSLMWDWLVAALSDTTSYTMGSDRSNLLVLYEKLDALVEVAFLLNEKHKTTQARKPVKKVKAPPVKEG